MAVAYLLAPPVKSLRILPAVGALFAALIFWASFRESREVDEEVGPRDLSVEATGKAAPQAGEATPDLLPVVEEAAQPQAEEPASRPEVATDISPLHSFSDWLKRYRQAAPEAKAALAAQGVELARSRRAALKQLISEDPRQALENALFTEERADLPAEIAGLLEERVNTRAFFGVLGVAPAEGALATAPIRREVRLGSGRRYEAHTFGRRLGQKTTENIYVNAIAVDSVLALDERPFRLLRAGERPSTGQRVVKVCPVSGQTAVAENSDGTFPPADEETPAVEVDGTIQYICSGGHIQAIEEQLTAQEGGSGGPTKPTTSGTSTQSTGVRTLLYMRVTFPEHNKEPQTEAGAYDMMKQVNDWVVENSYGNLYLLTTVAPLIVLPRTEAWYNGGGGDEYDLRSDAQAVARAMGYDTSQYDLDIVAYNGGPGSFGGLGYVGGKGSWLKSITVGVACHELGHNFGVWHANYWNTSGASIIGDGSNSEYGNSFDTMGSANAGDLQFNAQFKSTLKWLDAQSFVQRVARSGTYRIHAYDQSSLAPGQRYALRIDKDSDREYWAEFRQKSLSSNRWTKDGILLNWSPWSESANGTHLLDMTPGSPDGKTDAPLVIGRTFSDRESGIHITPIGKGGTSPESMDIVVNLGAFPGNQPPTFSLSASASVASANGTVTFIASAVDPDGDPLSYAWDFGDKTFGTSNAPQASKAWTAAGDYVVRCVVSDMKGGTASQSVTVRVDSPGTFRAAGRITLGGQPLAHVRVHNGRTAADYRGSYTDSDGRYIITGLAAGSYTLAAALEGHTFTAAFTNPVTVGPDVVDRDFTAAQTPRVTITATDASATEGAGTAQLTIARTGATTSALTVNLYAPSGTATRNGDYTLAPDLAAASPYQTISIPAGQASRQITLTATADTQSEGPEVARFEVVPGSGYTIGGVASASITIDDANSTLPRVSLAVVDPAGSESGDPAEFEVRRLGNLSGALTVRFAVAGTAGAGDFTSPGTQVVIPAGAASVPLQIAPIDDDIAEGDETVIVTLSTDAAYVRDSSLANYSATAVLADDDTPLLTVAAADATASEAAQELGVFLITRSGSLALPLTVNYALGGSAAHGIDYETLPGVVTIPAGLSSATVTVVPIDDGFGEPQQTVTLQLRGGAGYITAAPSLATINLNDNNDRPVVLLGVSDGVAAEPGTDVGKVRFTTRGTGAGNISVKYAVTGTATSGVDFTALSGTLSIGRNTSTEVTITPLDDTQLEGYESVVITLLPDAAYTMHLDASVTLLLRDNDQPMVNVSTSNDSFTEAGGTGKFWISRSGTTGDLVVNYTMEGTATNGSDYVALPGSITIPDGQAGAAISITPINDTVAEGYETITLALAPGSYGIGLGAATLGMADNESLAGTIRFDASSSTVAEDAGAIFLPVSRTGVTSQAATVEYVIAGGTATAGIDYQLAAGTLVFEPGQISAAVPLTIIDDSYFEPVQTITVRLQNANGASLVTNLHAVTITDNDALSGPRVFFSGAASNSLESQAAPAAIVALSAAQTAPVTVQFRATGGTATASADYAVSAGTITFAPGETARPVPLQVADDAAIEPDETVTLVIENPTGAALAAQATHTFTIKDNDSGTVTITAIDATAAEAGGDAGLLRVSRSGPLAAALTVKLTYSGTAASGSDYSSLPATITIPATVTTFDLPVAPINDSTAEGAETLIATVAADAAYLVGSPSSATVTILDDEPVVSILATDAAAEEAGPGAGEITISRTGATAAALTVNVSVSGSAQAGADYAAIVSPITIPAGSSTVTVPITPINDTLSEGDETVIVTLAASAGYLVGNPAAAIVTIDDDDFNTAPQVTLVSPAKNAIGIPTEAGLLLRATATDDGKPLQPGAMTFTWEKVSGPGTITFGDAAQRETTARFSTAGIYQVRFRATDGALESSVTVTVNAGSAAPGVFVEAGGQVVMEAEDFTGSAPGMGAVAGRTWQSKTSSSASGGVGLIILPNTGANAGDTTNGARLDYAVNFTTAGTYYLWVRMLGTGNEDDSLHAGLNGVPASFGLYGIQDQSGSWHWEELINAQRVRVTVPSPGLHTVNIWMREDGVELDRILLTTNVSFRPSGAGPASSERLNNLGPDVSAGPDSVVTHPAPATLSGSATDDGLPAGETLTTKWEKVSGPGAVSFADATELSTVASFDLPGAYVLRLIGSDGEVETYDDVAITANLTQVTITATDATAAESGLAAGEFRITRTGAADAPLTVYFAASGVAAAGEDYTALGSSATIPLGQASVTLAVAPLADGAAEGAEDVILTLTSDAAYALGAPQAATVWIADLPADDWRRRRFGADANNPAISGDHQDPDRDGRVNLFEYGLGSDPLQPNAEPATSLSLAQDEVWLEYSAAVEASDLQWSVLRSATLGTWTPATSATTETLSELNGIRRLRARLPHIGEDAEFFRLEIQRSSAP